MTFVRGDAPLARGLAVAAVILLPLAAWWLRTFPDAPSRVFPPCPLRLMTGAPCPTCGGTAALIALAHGKLAEALAANPLVTAAVVGLALLSLGGAVMTVVPSWRRRIEASPTERRRLALVALVVVAGHWAWLLIRTV